MRDWVAASLHWPSDIVGSAIIGIAIGLASQAIARKFVKRNTE